MENTLAAIGSAFVIPSKNGLTLGGNWTGVFYAVVDGGKPNVRGGFFDEEIQFIGELNVAKLTGCEPLEGLKGFISWREMATKSSLVAIVTWPSG